MAVACESDVVIVGAGAAGLAAAARLKAAGIGFQLLEAASAPGGRAASDRETLGTPFDLGCHWLHDARHNPFVPIAERLGFAFDARAPDPEARLLHLGSRLATAEEARAAHGAVEAAFAAVCAAGRAGRDVPARAVLPELGRWRPLAEHWLHLMSAAGLDRISTLDYSLYRDSDDNWPVLDGYGALVLAHARTAFAGDLPVTCDCPVRRIDHGGRELKVETARGTLRCRAVIVTVSTAVIASGRLAFTPELPADLAAAFAALPLGVAEKVALLFDRDVFGVAPRTGLDALREKGPAVSALLRPGGVNGAVVHLAGPEAGALVAKGPEALTAHALDALCDVFGAALRRHVVRTRATSWATMRTIGGGYSCALPGQGALRLRLRAPVEGRIFFAGEALGREAFSTCHGAHRSGIEAAEAVHALLAQGASGERP